MWKVRSKTNKKGLFGRPFFFLFFLFFLLVSVLLFLRGGRKNCGIYAPFSPPSLPCVVLKECFGFILFLDSFAATFFLGFFGGVSLVFMAAAVVLSMGKGAIFPPRSALFFMG